MYPNVEKMIVVLIRKAKKIITSIEVSLISWLNINYKKNDGKKTFLVNLKHQFRASQCGEHDCSANNEKDGDFYYYPSLPHFTDEL